jgi:hypothetical protein
MRYLACLAAVAALVAIGAAEATVSVQQLEDLPGRGRPVLSGGGASLTGLGLLLSTGVYLALGWVWRDRGARGAARTGAVVGIFAGLIGGTIRAAVVRDYLAQTVGQFGLPDSFTSWTLVVFVALSVAVSAAGGGAITWLAVQIATRRSPRPRP